MAERRASCSCGGLRVKTRGEPVRVSICHCIACQRRTGSTYGAQARFAEDQVEIEGESVEYARKADSGNTIRFRFCPSCGATVYYSLDEAPGIVAVPVGAFADPEFPAPRFSVYEARQHHWVHVPDDVEHYD